MNVTKSVGQIFVVQHSLRTPHPAAIQSSIKYTPKISRSIPDYVNTDRPSLVCFANQLTQWLNKRRIGFIQACTSTWLSIFIHKYGRLSVQEVQERFLSLFWESPERVLCMHYQSFYSFLKYYVPVQSAISSYQRGMYFFSFQTLPASVS